MADRPPLPASSGQRVPEWEPMGHYLRPQGQTSLPGEAGMDIFSTLGKVFKLTGCKRDQKLAIDAGHGLPRSTGRDGIGAWWSVC